MLAATERSLDKVKARVQVGKLVGADEIGVRMGKIVNPYKVAKHLALSITDTTLAWIRKADSIQTEAAPDGLYIVRTSPKAEPPAFRAIQHTRTPAAEIGRRNTLANRRPASYDEFPSGHTRAKAGVAKLPVYSCSSAKTAGLPSQSWPPASTLSEGLEHSAVLAEQLLILRCR